MFGSLGFSTITRVDLFIYIYMYIYGPSYVSWKQIAIYSQVWVPKSKSSHPERWCFEDNYLENSMQYFLSNQW